MLWLIAVAGSLLFNFLLVSGVAIMAVREISLQNQKPEKRTVAADMLQIVRDKKENKKEEEERLRLAADDKKEKLQEKKLPPSFLKTSKEQEAREAPRDPAFVGERNTKLGSERPANPDGLEGLPSVNGEKKRSDSDLSLIEQKGQMGVLENENPGRPGANGATVLLQKQQPRKPMVVPPLPEVRPQPFIPPADPSQPDPALAEKNNASAGEEQKKDNSDKAEPGKDKDMAASDTEGQDKDGKPVKAVPDPKRVAKVDQDPPKKNAGETEQKKDVPVDPDSIAREEVPKQLRDIMKTAEKFNLPDPRQPVPAAPRKVASASASKPSVGQPAIKKRPPIYDPALADGGIPGYRSQERKTRISGQMSASGAVAADVKSTPLGAYQAKFLRKLNRNWDKECVERRDFIIPGSLKIRFFLNKNGTVSGIRLLSKEGASEIQKGFTFKAIKETSMPAMDAPVLKELGDDATELVIDFFF